jgi:hypothetical protein
MATMMNFDALSFSFKAIPLAAMEGTVNIEQWKDG